jgi:mannose-1-phosphate guanylyltransferase / mannose-6-phosphate isomerase
MSNLHGREDGFNVVKSTNKSKSYTHFLTPDLTIDHASLITPVILAGGAGTRLWPLSRRTLPKQFLALHGDGEDEKSLFQQAVIRVSDPRLFAPPVIITHVDFRFFVAEQLDEMGIKGTLLLEPERRDSASAVAAASLFVSEHNPQALVLILAADHVIEELAVFHEACERAAEMAATGKIVTFGITPTSPNTAYGYIRPSGEKVGEHGFGVAQFVEKPDALTAQRYCDEGCMWNSGNFMFCAQTMCDELQHHAPDVFNPILKAVQQRQIDHVQELVFERLAPEPFAHAPTLSIDYAVMEKTARASVLPCAFTWSDMGSWDAVWQHMPHDQVGNASKGAAVLSHTTQSLVHADGPLVTLHNVHDLAVIATKDAVLVMPRMEAKEQAHTSFKALITHIEKGSYAPHLQPSRVHRPWGYYEEVDRGARFLVKRIVVKPEKRLSLQHHVHRSEHWVVVRGTAEVTLGKDVRLIQENESIYVPLGTPHRLANPGKIPLEVIEVQTGSYLAEDDIVRLSDDFNRV